MNFGDAPTGKGFWFPPTILAPIAESDIQYTQEIFGPVAQIGLDSIAALKTAVEIVNEDINLDMPFAKGKGLPGLKGAKVRLVVSDHQGKPEIGQGEAERLINNEKVHALFGAYFSAVTATSSLVADRAGIPYVNGASTAPNLTDRGLKYFFRVTPHDGEFTQVMYDFMADLQKKKLHLISSRRVFFTSSSCSSRNV